MWQKVLVFCFLSVSLFGQHFDYGVFWQVQQKAEEPPVPVTGTVLAMLKPVKTYGHNQAWSVLLSSTCSVPVVVTRASILIETPQILELPNDIAEASLLYAYGRKSIGGKLADAGATLSSTGLTAAGVASGSKEAVIAGAGISLGQLLVHLIWTPTDPSKFFSDLLPDAVMLPPYGGATGYGVVSSQVVKKAKPTNKFPIPGVCR